MTGERIMIFNAGYSSGYLHHVTDDFVSSPRGLTQILLVKMLEHFRHLYLTNACMIHQLQHIIFIMVPVPYFLR